MSAFRQLACKVKGMESLPKLHSLPVVHAQWHRDRSW